MVAPEARRVLPSIPTSKLRKVQEWVSLGHRWRLLTSLQTGSRGQLLNAHKSARRERELWCGGLTPQLGQWPQAEILKSSFQTLTIYENKPVDAPEKREREKERGGVIFQIWSSWISLANNPASSLQSVHSKDTDCQHVLQSPFLEEGEDSSSAAQWKLTSAQTLPQDMQQVLPENWPEGPLKEATNIPATQVVLGHIQFLRWQWSFQFPVAFFTHLR